MFVSIILISEICVRLFILFLRKAFIALVVATKRSTTRNTTKP